MPILRSAHPSMPKRRGFTLIELMVTLTVAGILLAVGVPSFIQLIANNRIATQTNEFIGALSLARGEAVRRAQPMTVRSQAGTLEFATGWKMFTDADADGAPASTVTATDGTVIRETSGLAGKTTLKRVTCTVAYTCADAVSADRMYVVFNARGSNNGGIAYFKVCDSSSSTIKGRVIQLSTTGRVGLVSSTAACP